MKLRRMISALIILCVTIGNFTVFAATAVDEMAEFYISAGSKDDWAVIGLARSGYKADRLYYDNYYNAVEKLVKDTKGVLSANRFSEYSRLVLSLTAIGRTPANVAGYNLLEPLGDFGSVTKQGINGAAFALLALDSAGYDSPVRTKYIEFILGKQLADGGFALSGNVSDPDVTGIVLQALAKYQDRQDVKAATQKALAALSKLQNADGGFSSMGIINCESACQVLMALCELGISETDSRFVKNGFTLTDNILSYYIDGIGFIHTAGGSISDITSAQAFYALIGRQRILAGKQSLYRMSDVVPYQPLPDRPSGLHSDIQLMPVLYYGKTYDDIKSHANQNAIEALVARGIINGVTDNTFEPDRGITRAELATIVIRALGLKPEHSGRFTDVPAASWYAAFVDTACKYGIVNGVSTTHYAPARQISRQEAALMMANAAGLCGLDTQLSASETRNILAQFPDYTSSAEYSRAGLAFCYRENILSQDDIYIRPAEAATRAEVAEMVYRLLSAAGLL